MQVTLNVVFMIPLSHENSISISFPKQENINFKFWGWGVVWLVISDPSRPLASGETNQISARTLSHFFVGTNTYEFSLTNGTRFAVVPLVVESDKKQ